MPYEHGTSSPKQQDLSTKVIEWEDTFELGSGIDFVTRQPRRSVLKNYPTVALKTNAGHASQKVRASMKWVSTKEELVETLSTELNGAGTISTPKGGGGGSFFAKYVQSITIKKYHLNCVLLVQALNATQFISDLEVEEELRTQLPPDFLGKYGDHILAGLRTGGLYLGVIEIVTDSEEKKREVQGKIGMRAHAGPSMPSMGNLPQPGGQLPANKKEEMDDSDQDDGSDSGLADEDSGKIGPDTEKGSKILGGSGGLAAALSRASTVENVEIRTTVDRIGGNGPVAFDDPQRMIQDAANFPADVQKNGEKLSAIVRPYGLVGGLQDVRSENILNAQFLHYRDELEKRAIRAISILEHLNYALKHVETFTPAHKSAYEKKKAIARRQKELAEAHSKTTQYLSKINKKLIALNKDPRGFVGDEESMQLPALLDLDILPKRVVGKSSEITPADIGNLEGLTRKLAAVKERAIMLDASAEFLEALDALGSHVLGICLDLHSGCNELISLLDSPDIDYILDDIDDFTAQTRAIRRKIGKTLPDLIADLVACSRPDKSASKFYIPSMRLDNADTKQQERFKLEFNSVLAALRDDGNGSTGGLFPHVRLLEKATREISSAVALAGEGDPEGGLTYDAFGWDARMKEYGCAYDRLTGRYVVKVT